MKSIVLELQSMASDSETSVSDLLRKTKIVAIKLDLPDLLGWVENELNGYSPDSEERLPGYRYISGEVKAWNPFHGWQPIMFSSNEWYDILSKRGISQSVGELDAIMNSSNEDGTLYVDFAPSVKNTICDAIGHQTDIKFHTGSASVAAILDGVRNLILDWSLKLEKLGILGEDMTFSKEEKKKAHESGTTFNIQNFAGTIGDVTDNASVTINQLNQVKSKEINSFLDQVEGLRDQLKLSEDKDLELQKNISSVREELVKSEPDRGIVSRGLSSIKRIAEGASGNLVAQGILSSIGQIIS